MESTNNKQTTEIETNITEIEFHEKRIEFIPDIIAGKQKEIEFIQLYSKINPEGNEPFIDKILDTIDELNIQISSYSQYFQTSENFLESQGIDFSPIH